MEIEFECVVETALYMFSQPIFSVVPSWETSIPSSEPFSCRGAVMEIEFDVKITSNILYDYMLRHTYRFLNILLRNCFFDLPAKFSRCRCIHRKIILEVAPGAAGQLEFEIPLEER